MLQHGVVQVMLAFACLLSTVNGNVPLMTPGSQLDDHGRCFQSHAKFFRDQNKIPVSYDRCSPSGVQCTFYQCLEDKHQCGPHGYPLGFGLDICSRFAANADLFDQEGKAWMHDVRLCLQEALYMELCDVPNLDDRSDACEVIQQRAINTHTRCFLENGYCKLPSSTKRLIMKTLGLQAMWSAPGAMRQFFDTMYGCFGIWLDSKQPQSLESQSTLSARHES